MKYINSYEFKIGRLWICADENNILEVSFSGKFRNDYINRETELILKTKQELEEYFSGKRREFNLPVKPQGSEFQKKVWKALCEVPYGKTCTYKDIACKIGNPKACRAVGGANNKNPIAIIIPCHRVIGANGKLTGYSGGLKIKKELLENEKHT